jgi:hypothetical protein
MMENAAPAPGKICMRLRFLPYYILYGGQPKFLKGKVNIGVGVETVFRMILLLKMWKGTLINCFTM